MNPVAITGLLVAAIRAEETQRPDALFRDPFADSLAGADGRAALARYRSAVGPSIPIIEVRTRYFDEAIARAASTGARQFVILAAGMDARAHRLEWPPGSRVFELDQPAVMAAKDRALAAHPLRCERIAIGTDLGGDWPAALAAHGFQRHVRTTWLVEGALQYLEPALVEALFERLDRASLPGSIALYDMVGRSLLDSPALASTLKMMSELGAPWRFGSDNPEAMLPGWDVRATDPAVIGNGWKRWPFPALPPGAPRGYLLEATKR
jgi:methyltransferase (TIGR00027 family)